MENRNEISLKGGAIHLSGSNDEVYEVVSGHVLVYILPLKNETAGRRYLLREALPEEKIPGFCEEAPTSYEDSTPARWCFGLVALDVAVLRVSGGCTEEARAGFAANAGLHQYEDLGFRDCLLEAYQLNITTELRNIYASTLEQKNTYEKGLKLIAGFFGHNRLHKNEKREKSGNPLYDAIAHICDRKNIPLAGFDVVRSASGRRFSAHDIARISHFSIRNVVLPEGWFRQDSGPILAYTQEGNSPVACMPKGPTRYVAYDPVEDREYPVNAAYAATLNPQALMLYRPLPNRKVTKKDLFWFGFQDIYARDIVRIVILALIGTLIGLLVPYMNEQLYDNFIPMGNATGLVQVCGVILSCMVGNALFTVVKNLATLRSSNTMKYAVQGALYDRLFNLPQSFFRQFESADLATRAMGISDIFSKISDLAVQQGLSALFALLFLFRMFKYSKKLSWIALLMLVLAMALVSYLGSRQLKYKARKMELAGKTNSLMYQILSGISKLRIAGVENRALYEYLKPFTESRKVDTGNEHINIFINNVMGQAMPTIFSMVFYFIMVRQSITLSIGSFMGFNSAWGSFSGAIIALVTGILQANEIKPQYDRLRPILDTCPEFEDDMELPGDITGELEINNVTFAYDPEVGPVLKDLSLHVKAGEYIGVVGSSGCGKSTLLKLLLGFEKPQTGKIYYDGRDIDAMDKRELRKKLGVVLQDGGLISGSIYDNITITAPGTTASRVQEVIKDVGLEDDVAQMPMGLHTMLSEGSGTISGGQRQRVLIARALVGKPKVIYFDEATSALDNVTQSMVCESLEKLTATRLVIAHRLSTVINCDRIIVMDAGHIVEQGNYEELMAHKGRFYELASRQIS